MEKYLEIIKNSYSGYWNYLKNEVVLLNNWDNYFYGLILISLLVWLLEVLFPWRKNQSLIRRDFWLDTFYMFFNFFLLNLIVLIALSNTAAELFNDALRLVGIQLGDLQLFAQHLGKGPGEPPQELPAGCERMIVVLGKPAIRAVQLAGHFTDFHHLTKQ